ncbi:hypothetical protein PLCT1_00442 [Planctomycetaceae bacterium]|nr:hypothetical protein PLCT1_00442 [Planctomycetaceae bacterium]
MDELLIRRWLQRRVRSMRLSILAMAAAMLTGSFFAYNITWFCLFIPLALIGLGIGLPVPGAGSTLFITATTIGYFFVRQRRPLPVPEVTRTADSTELAISIPPIREHWLRVRSRDQVSHLTLRSLLYELLFITPMLLESAASVLKHWKRLGRIDIERCAKAVAVLHRDLEKTTFTPLEKSLPGEDMAALLGQLWWLDDVQFINTGKQGLILTEQARLELAAAEDAALIASVG